MKTKIFLTLCALGLAQASTNVFNKLTEGVQKYTALGQLDNTETSFQVFHATNGLVFINYIVLAFIAFGIYSIWKPKKTVDNTPQ